MTTKEVKHDSVYLIQQQWPRGPREYQSAYETVYVTRAVCSTLERANELVQELKEREKAHHGYVLLQVPADQTFSAEHHNGELNAYGGSGSLGDCHVPASTAGKQTLYVDPATYTRDRKIKEAEMMTRYNVRPVPPPPERRIGKK